LIPIQLRLKNFMCYKDNVAPLSFEGIHVACLCGDNGSGKSSIFDAITWALWGEASRGKSNDDLIYTGQNDMEVELDFTSANEHFRVIRKYSRSTTSRSGQTMLDLQLLTSGKFKQIAEHTKTETQERLLGILHLDYQTFINSAMLLQGRANEFSKKRPGERKEILANILDLSFYDQLEQQARSYADTNKSESIIMERELSGLQLKINERPQYESANNEVLVELKNIIQLKQATDGTILELRQKKDSLASRKEQLHLISQQLTSRQKDLDTWQNRIVSSQSSIERFSKVLVRKDEIENGFSEFRRVAALEEQLNEKLKRSLELVERKNKLEGLITAAQNVYASEFKTLSTRVTELESKYNRLPGLQQKLAELLQHQQELAKTEDIIEANKRQLNHLTASISSISTLNSELTTSAQEIKRKVELMSHAGAACPLCESELGPDGCARIEKKLTEELQQKLSQTQDNNSKRAAHKAELDSLEKEIRRQEPLYKADRDKIKQQIALTGRETDEAKSSEAELSSKKVALQKLSADIRNKNYTIEEQKAVIAIEQEQKELSYDPAAHKKVSQNRLTFQSFENLNVELSEAKLQIKNEEKIKADSEAAVAHLQEELIKLNAQSSQVTADLVSLPEIVAQLEAVEKQQSSLLNDERKLRDRLAELGEKLKQLDILVTEKQEKEKALQHCKEEESIFSELARDFGKRGIQALIIADTLPEIENEANILLAKMTENRMSLTLETERGTKKGDMIETLDIKIADELGTRSYEMYSGGEAFRIDLALRIAISRLLVRRTGASMPILIIDEGFGTQDNAGLEKLVEAINSIQDDFEKLFVITHLEELKERFPVLINITKTAEGSQISVSQ